MKLASVDGRLCVVNAMHYRHWIARTALVQVEFGRQSSGHGKTYQYSRLNRVLVVQ